MTILLIVAGILLELIVLVGGIYLTLKYFHKFPTISDKIETGISNKNITSDIIRDGVKSALQEITYEQEKIRDRKIKSPEYIYSTTPQDEIVRNSGGELIPFNLSEKDKELLNMFYND